MTCGPPRRHNSLKTSELQRLRFYLVRAKKRATTVRMITISILCTGGLRFNHKASFVFLGQAFLDKTNHATLGIKEASI